MVSRSFSGGSRRIAGVFLLIAFLALPGWGAGGISSAYAASRNAAPQAARVSIKMAFSTWTGYGPLVVASQLGYFQRYGLNVSYDVVEDANARKAAIQAGRLDVAPGQDDVRSISRQRSGDGRTETLGGSGNNRNPAGQRPLGSHLSRSHMHIHCWSSVPL